MFPSFFFEMREISNGFLCVGVRKADCREASLLKGPLVQRGLSRSEAIATEGL